MGNDVFANGREISCKAADGKAIAAFPDVCFTPPQTPATPPGVPIPYPNNGMASDATKGSKKVKISNKEVMLKNKSYFKKSSGDEAGNAPKKGVITSKIQGKVYFNAWSMDVKFEGENVVRHMDLTTHNHASQTGQTPPWMYMDSMAMETPPPDHPCKNEIDEAQKACKGAKVIKKKGKRYKDCSGCEGNCKEKMACILVPKEKDKELCCSPHNTGHHLIPEHCCKGVIPGYKGKKAPTVCAGGWSWHRKDRSGIADADKTHPQIHEIQDPIERKVLRIVGKLAEVGAAKGRSRQFPWKYQTVRNIGISAHKKTFKKSNCSANCVGSQLDDYHLKSDKVDRNTNLKAKEYGNKISPDDKSFNKWKERFPDL
jgi:hypothetical protein